MGKIMNSEEGANLLKIYKYNAFDEKSVVMTYCDHDAQQKTLKDIGKILRDSGYTGSYGVRVKGDT